MDFTNLKRDGKKAKAAWRWDEESKQIFAEKRCSIIFPKNWINGKLGTLTERFNVLAYFAIVVDGKYYGVSDAMNIMPFTPQDIGIVKHENQEYYVLSWEVGALICPNFRLVQDNQLGFHVFDQFTGKGNTPWYMDINDVALQFKTAKQNAKVDLKANLAIQGLFAATRMRVKGDLNTYAKVLMEHQDLIRTMKPSWISLMSVAYAASNTLAKLGGGYIVEGMNSAMINPTDKPELKEQLVLT